MNIYDLNRNATPRPDNPGNCHRRLQAMRRFDEHCRNNFLKALDALKGAEHLMPHDSTCNVRYHETAECECAKSELQQLIRELEEVET